MNKNHLLWGGSVSALLLLGYTFYSDPLTPDYSGGLDHKSTSAADLTKQQTKSEITPLKITHPLDCGCAQHTRAVAAKPSTGKADAPNKIFPAIELDQSVMDALLSHEMGDEITFDLPGGKKAQGSVDLTKQEDGEVIHVQGRLTSPQPGFYFFRKQSMDGVAGPLVGVIHFDEGEIAYRVDPTDSGSELAMHPVDNVLCRNYAPEPLEMPSDHTTDGAIPAYQTGVIPLQSFPEATGVVYLDFDGDEGPMEGWAEVRAAPANIGNDRIKEIWGRVSEDFAPFNLNVTTDEQVYLNAPQNSRIRCMVSDNGGGGVAFLGSYNWDGDMVCWAYNAGGKSGAEVITHEVGHALGLYHDGRTDPSEGYYGGHGSGEVSWGPLMGVGYYTNVTTWSRGEYLNADNGQDDISVIALNNNNIGYRPDDHTDTLATASYLEILADDSVSNQGLIESQSDFDGFRFTTSGGSVSLTVTPMALGPNLDLLAEIVDSTGAVVASDNPDTLLAATVSASLTAGDYFLRVSGVGRGDVLGDGYSDYASLGNYAVSGTVANGVKPDRLSVAENSSNGTAVGTVIPKNNHGAATLTYTIASGNSSGAMAINSGTGALTVADTLQLNYETLSLRHDDPAEFELFVDITNASTPSLNETVRVVIEVTDVNEAHQIVGSTLESVTGSAVGDVVADFHITGEDHYYANQPAYSIVSGNGSGAFAIDDSGRVTVLNVSAFTNEEEHVLTISAVDGDTGFETSDTHTITIKVHQKGASTSFAEAAIDDVKGVYLDVPDPALASVTLDTVNAELDVQTTGPTDMWSTRAGAPMAYALRPDVSIGETWYAETHLKLNGTFGVLQHRIAGMTFYPDQNGVGPLPTVGGMAWSVGLNEWDDRGVEIQGFNQANIGNYGANVINPSPAVKGISEVYLRVEVTENGLYDYYRVYYKQTSAGAWIQLAEFDSDNDNSRVGLFLKNGDIGAAERSVSFSEFHVGRLGGVNTAFEEASLGGANGLALDIPNTAAAAVTLDKVNDELDITTSGPADMWINRADAPIAYATRPVVAAGNQWYAETHMRLNGAIGTQQRIAGLVFYPDQDGAGGSSDGMQWSVELNEWDGRGVEVQGLNNQSIGDSGLANINPSPLVNGISEAFFRVEVTENGASDLYEVYYKLTAGDTWTKFAEFNSDVDNSRIGLFMKNGSIGAAERSVSFTYFNVGEMPSRGIDSDFSEPALGQIAGLGLDIPNQWVGTVALDKVNDEIDLTTSGWTDLWTERADTPIAYARKPEVLAGETWYAESHLRLNGTAGVQQRIAGLLFYPDQDGVGGSNGGMQWSVGLNEWDDRGIDIQGLGSQQIGDSGLTFINPAPLVNGVSEAYFRVEVTENGVSDLYKVYYKLTLGDAWTQFAEFNSDVDNSRVGLFMKNGDLAETERSVSFSSFKVEKLENTAPVANDATLAVTENSSIGTSLGTVVATDPDVSDTLSYAITAGNGGGEFTINSSTGEITTAAALDFETATQYVLTVTVSDDGTPTLADTSTITVDVTDVNEAPVASDTGGSLAENGSSGAAVASVSAMDVDSGDNLSYAITSGNGSGLFAIDANGNITTTGALDFESASQHVLTVTVTDNGSLSDTATVTVDVTDANEAPVANNTVGNVAEDASVGTTVASVSASDVDSGASLSYAITAGNTGNAFSIDSNGNVKTATALDYETTANYSLTVTVSDGLLSDTAIVSITVDDVAEVTAPVIATGAASNLGQETADIAYSVTDEGGEAPTVTIYYGETDGGQSAGAWDSNVAVGVQSVGSYVESLTALTEGTEYFFTVHATNSAGEVWGSSSSFTTEADTSPKMVRTTVSAVSSTTWVSVDLGQNYNSAVIVATPIYADSTQVPVVTSIRNVSGSSFELKLDRADGLTAETTAGVSVIAVEEGVYTLAADGVQMEAVKFTSTITANRSGWNAEARTYQNSYTTPVVVGQVMSANDSNWSTFWSMGSSRLNPADASNLNVGKHVAEDPNTTRANETIGYIVIESGNGTINGVAYTAAVGSDIVRNYENSSSGYSYNLTGLTSASAAALSSSGMDGTDGAWPVLNGLDALSASTVKLVVDEDQLKDSEQKHATEQINYLIFE